MPAKLECADRDEHDITPAEYYELGNCVRRGRPFRNVVAQYAPRAQAPGPAAPAALHAVLSD